MKELLYNRQDTLHKISKELGGLNHNRGDSCYNVITGSEEYKQFIQQRLRSASAPAVMGGGDEMLQFDLQI